MAWIDTHEINTGPGSQDPIAQHKKAGNGAAIGGDKHAQVAHISKAPDLRFSQPIWVVRKEPVQQACNLFSVRRICCSDCIHSVDFDAWRSRHDRMGNPPWTVEP